MPWFSRPLIIDDGFRRYGLIEGLGLDQAEARPLSRDAGAWLLRDCIGRDPHLLARIRAWRGSRGSPEGRSELAAITALVAELRRGTLTLTRLPPLERRGLSYQRPLVSEPFVPDPTPSSPILGADEPSTLSVRLTISSFEGDCPPLAKLPLHVDHRQGTIEQARTDADGTLEYEDLPVSHGYTLFAGRSLDNA